MRLPSFLIVLFLFFSPFTFAQKYWLGVKEENRERTWAQSQTQDSRRIELDSILTSYRNLGYLGVEFDEILNREDSLWVDIRLGPQLELVHLQRGNLPEGYPVRLGAQSFGEVNYGFGKILEHAENHGYPFASVAMDEISRNGSQLNASIKFDPGPIIVWDSVKVGEGNQTSEKYLQRLVGIEVGAPFSQKQMERAANTINRSPYFKISASPNVAFQFQKASPTFFLNERNANVIDGIIGFLPNENEPGKLLLTGQVNLQLFHLGGKGRDIQVQWQRFNQLTQSLEIGAKESFIFNSPLDVRGGFSLLKQDSTFLKRDLGVEFGYHVNPNFYLKFLANRVASDLLVTYSYEEITELPEVADFRWSEYGVSSEWNRLDNIISPRRGFKVNSKISAGNKRILENTGLPEIVYDGVDMNTPQYSFQAKAEKHIYLKPSWGMFVGIAGGIIRNENLLLNDLFRIGGLQSIRGFNENFFYASSYAYLNVEQRLFFGENSYLLIFLDGGVLENDYLAMSKEKPFSLGAGLNFETGTGVFRFIYAAGKSSQQELSFSQSKIHFGYLARF